MKASKRLTRPTPVSGGGKQETGYAWRTLLGMRVSRRALSCLLLIGATAIALPSGAEESRQESHPTRAGTYAPAAALVEWGGDLEQLQEIQATTAASSPSSGLVFAKPGSDFERFTLLASDLDGDGFQDLLKVVTKNTHGNVLALRGVDGSVMWSYETDNLLGLGLAGDISGDGGDDILVVTVDWGQRPSLSESRMVPQELKFLAGRDGQFIKAHVEMAAIEVTMSPDLPAGAEIIKARNLLLSFSVLDRETRSALFLDLYDVEHVGAFAVEYLYHDTVTEHASVFDPFQSRIRASVTTTGFGGVTPYTVPIGDFDGDARTDLLVWELPLYPSGERVGVAVREGLSAFSGQDGSHFWSTNPVVVREEGTRFSPGVVPTPVRRAGRTYDDLLLDSTAWVPNRLTLLDGRTGEEVWRVTLPRGHWNRATIVMGDADLDGYPDIAQIRQVGDCTDIEVFITCYWDRWQFSAYSGATGTSLWERPVGYDSAPIDRSTGEIESFGEHSGDRVLDLRLETDTTGSGGPYAQSAISGATGETLWTQEPLPPSHQPTLLGADITGDGREDLSGTVQINRPDGGYEVLTRTYSGLDGRELWTSGSALNPAREGAFAVDLVPQSPGPEVVQTSLGDSGSVISAFSSTGGLLWRFGS